MGSPNFSTNAFIGRLIGLEKSLQGVKSKLYYFCEHIEESHLKYALRKVFDYIPALELAVPKENTGTSPYLLPENNSLNRNGGIPINQPKKYCTFQSYPLSETIIVRKVPLKKKKFDDSGDSKSATTDKRPIQLLIVELDKAIQNLHTVIESLVDTLERQQESNDMNTTLWRDINYAEKQLRFHIPIILRGVAHLNKHRQMTRLLSVLRYRGTILNVISKLEEEGKQRKWKI